MKVRNESDLHSTFPSCHPSPQLPLFCSTPQALPLDSFLHYRCLPHTPCHRQQSRSADGFWSTFSMIRLIHFPHLSRPFRAVIRSIISINNRLGRSQSKDLRLGTSIRLSLDTNVATTASACETTVPITELAVTFPVVGALILGIVGALCPATEADWNVGCVDAADA